ncbi:SET domain-containing protein [Punctularia strigosozonata HHB-11173 SS5]|uniref:SET domain-containing protein n=1 Tax=Punctularia strigosozonata (strain HHB-11173) TaxID=741275 RepID=UPI0004417C6F|nr:SET domain-containing protein [Punctularia strigosozonata HHB-11173 SS5]EIN07420.1 SET domain-containing protein [Punctularia strigosozonata HHB-11173 SS5]
MPEFEDDAPWRNLLAWLHAHGMKIDSTHLRVERRPSAGYGLFTTMEVSPSSPLFTIPAAALMTVKTLAPHYPNCTGLSATQLISMHLYIHRPDTDRRCTDSLYEPFINVLPGSFDFHPLTWLVWALSDTHVEGEREIAEALLQALSPSVRRDLEELKSRFDTDTEFVQKYLAAHPRVLATCTRTRTYEAKAKIEDRRVLDDMLWAWLNVNTRCIFHRLKPSVSSRDNIALVPILDMANHRPYEHACPSSLVDMALEKGRWAAPVKGRFGPDFTLLSPRDQTLRSGEEVFLRYGAHSNRKLFVEYGFVNSSPGSEHEGSAPRGDGQVDVQILFEDMLREQGSRGEWMRDVLKDQGYWGDWTLHASPAPAHPSFRLLTALRLYHLVLDCPIPPPNPEDVLRPWHDTLAGRRPLVSRENEQALRQTLLQMCERLQERAREGLSTTDMIEPKTGSPVWAEGMKDNIRVLWREEEAVARAVEGSIRAGDEF